MTFALHLQTETALIYDAVYLFARGLHGVEKAKNMNFRQGIMCNSSTSWEDGLSLLNYMKTVCSKATNQTQQLSVANQINPLNINLLFLSKSYFSCYHHTRLVVPLDPCHLHGL